MPAGKKGGKMLYYFKLKVEQVKAWWENLKAKLELQFLNLLVWLEELE